jgi:hypothetical protein
MSDNHVFLMLAPKIMTALKAEFALDNTEAAAICGNLGHESGGFKFLQELKPLVPGSKGGYGWAQWTGPRRRAYEAYCKGRKVDPVSYEANLGYLIFELKYTERGAIPALKKAFGLEAKVKAFELNFERAAAQYKHYESRIVWAKLALQAYAAVHPAPPL